MTPDINAEPWILPLITLKLIASDSTEIENLLYTWELDAFDETLLDIQINFFKPNKISQSLNPEKLFVELRIQQFEDKDGFGIPDKTNFTLFVPT